MSFFNWLFSKISPHSHNSNTYRKQLYVYYKEEGYKVIPEIPSEEDSERILEQMEVFPSTKVPKQYMNPLSNGLLRGEIILLWWLNKPRTNKTNPPRYLLYKYGINVQNHLLSLEKEGYITPNKKLTQKGSKLLERNTQIIREHKAVKGYESNGDITYIFSDKKVAEDMGKFKSSGNLVKDQFIGKSFEKVKDYKNAIKAYHSAYSLSLKDKDFKDSPPPNIFNRLAIIYRKFKQYEKEVNIIQEALRYYPENKSFLDRLEKAKSSSKKNKTS